MAQSPTWRVSEASATELGTQNGRGKAQNSRTVSNYYIDLGITSRRRLQRYLSRHKTSELRHALRQTEPSEARKDTLQRTRNHTQDHKISRHARVDARM